MKPPYDGAGFEVGVDMHPVWIVNGIDDPYWDTGIYIKGEEYAYWRVNDDENADVTHWLEIEPPEESPCQPK